MKKLASILTGLLLVTGLTIGTVNAQTAAPAKATTTTTTTTTKAAKSAGTHLKKDGTADKRFKENKVAATTATTTHVKKDGTPDKRFKENKTK